MAITISNLRRQGTGLGYMSVFDLALDNSYPTGGYFIDPNAIGLARITNLSTYGSDGGYLFEFDYVNNKFKVFSASGGGTPAGSNSSESAGTPSGTNSSESAGTPSGTVSQPVFSGDALSPHNHTLIQQAVSGVTVSSNTAVLVGPPVIMTSVYVNTGSVTGLFQEIPNSVSPIPSGHFHFDGSTATITFLAADNVTDIDWQGLGAVAQGASAGTPSGTVSQPTFTGDALGNHTHTFAGDALGNHTHTFTGTPLGGGAASEVANGTDLSGLTKIEVFALQTQAV